MNAKTPSIGTKSLWTVGSYGISATIRFTSNIVLSRLLGPAILGAVVIAQAIRVGCDLLSDLGLEQNVVHSRAGEDETFLNTVWTMQILRGLAISLICLALSPFMAKFYRIDILVMVAVSASPLINSLTSTSLFSLAKKMDVKSRNLFEISSELTGLIINIILAVFLRNIWAPILGILFTVSIRSGLTWVLPHPRHRLTLDRSHMSAIIKFSKWIMLASLSLYASVYIDRLYLGRVLTLSTLGIYGQARSIAELPNTVAGRLAFQLIFPFVAKHQAELHEAAEPYRELSRIRRNFLTLIAVGIASVMAWSDKAVLMLYGARYAPAGWMLCLLLIGVWIAVISSLNEAIVFGRGEPRNIGLANAIRFFVMAVSLPSGFALGGLPGVFIALPLSELARYGILLNAQRRHGLSYCVQDLLSTVGIVTIFAFWIGMRVAFELGVPWTGIH